MATPKTYSNAELNALVAEFSAEFDQLVKAEVAKTGQSLSKSEPLAKEDDESPPPKKDEGSESASAESAPPESAGPPAADPAASAAPPPAADPASASPGAPPPGDPAAQAAGTDPQAALKQAYAQLSPEELQMHFMALKEVLMAQQAGAAGGMPPGGAPPGMDPAAAAGGMAPPAPAAAGAPPAPAPAGPGAVAPLAGEGSQPLDPAATMALKSEFDKQLNLVKSERDASAIKVQELEKSVSALAEAMTKVFSQPVRKSITGKDLDGLLKSELPESKVSSLSKAEITKKLLTVSRDPSTKNSDRDLINKYYSEAVKVNDIAHLLE
jgi:hypothetical protein